jgi:hypothetical protein
MRIESCVFATNTATTAGASVYSFKAGQTTMTNCVYEGTPANVAPVSSLSTPDAGVVMPLADNGGPTLTHAIEEDSPARNAGSNPGELLYDQRGPGFPRDDGKGVDCGAYEIPPPPPGTVVIFR